VILIVELKLFVKTILSWLYSFVLFSIFLFTFGLEQVTVFGNTYLLPLPTANSFSAQVFSRIRNDLLPTGVQLVVTNPLSAFVSQIILSTLLGFLVTIPLLTYKVILYLQPALLPHERRAVLLSIAPFVFLFSSGALFSYFFLIPATFEVLYPYTVAIGATPFFAIDEFTQYVFGLMFAVGLMFLLPMFMILLSIMGIINPQFWGNKWRYAVVFFLVLSAIITPDGTGVTMILLFLPLAALYFIGYVCAKRLNRDKLVVRR
jgi:sec-independent protein translocase protein TatC